MDLEFKLPVFEGPLDLLLHLIEKNKVDIYDIPIVEITNQYMDYVRRMDKEDLDSASEFLVMAATLIDIKCRMLMPQKNNEDEEEIDPRNELVEKLIEYKKCKYEAEELRDLQVYGLQSLYRGSFLPKEVEKYVPKPDLNSMLCGVDLEKLNEVFLQVLKRQEDRKDSARSGFSHIEVEEVSLPEKIQHVSDTLKRRKSCSFKQILSEGSDKMDVIVSFLAILELMKDGRIRARQENTFDEIYIDSVA